MREENEKYNKGRRRRASSFYSTTVVRKGFARLLSSFVVLLLLVGCVSLFFLSFSSLQNDEHHEHAMTIRNNRELLKTLPTTRINTKAKNNDDKSSPLVISDWRHICDILEQHNNDPKTILARPSTIQFRTDCSPASTGNKLAQYYMMQLLVESSTMAGGETSTSLVCIKDDGKHPSVRDKNNDGSILSMLAAAKTTANGHAGTAIKNTTGATNFPPSWQSICSSCRSHFPHVCSKGLNLMVNQIQRDLRQSTSIDVVSNHNKDSTTIVDDLIIHVRCGDMLDKQDARLFRSKYGYSPYRIYDSVIQEHSATLKTIGILSQRLDQESCQPKSCPFVTTCHDIVRDVQIYLQMKYSHIQVSIRNDDTSITTAYARMIHARKGVICDSSTFCLFPAIASYGVGYIVQNNELYPWVNSMSNNDDGVKVLSRSNFLSVKEIAQRNMGAKEIIQWRREM